MGPTRCAHAALAAAAAVLALGAAACSSRDATSVSVALSPEDVFSLAGELSQAMSPAGFPGLNGPVAINLGCPLGGTLSVVGRDTTYSPSYARTDVTFGFQGCKTAHFTTTGSVRLTGSVTTSATVDSAAVIASGELSVATSNGRFSDCSVDLQALATATQTIGPTYSVAGGACGVDLSGRY
jgi:hypothetical protein